MLIAGERRARVIMAEYIKQTTPDAATKETDLTCAPPTTPNVIPFPAPPHQIRRRQLLGGLINEHQSAA